MDPKEITKALTEALENSLPEAVETVVDAKMKQATSEITKSQDDLKKQIEDLAVSAKMNSGTESTKEAMIGKAHSVVAKSFKKIYSEKITSEAVAAEVFDSEIKAVFQNESTAGEGAEFVFAEFDRNVFYVLKTYPVVNELGIISIKGTSITLPTWENTLAAYWTDEGANITKSKGKTDKIVYAVHKLASLVGVTDEMFDDNMTDEDLYSLIVSSAAAQHAATIENGIINGESGKMTGILENTDVSVVSVASGNTTLRAASATAVDDALLDLDAAVSPEYQTRSDKLVAIMSKYTLNQYRKKKNANGIPMFPELRGKNPMLLDTYRVIVSNKAPVQSIAEDVAGAKHTIVGDLSSFYRLVRRRGISATRGFATGDFEGGKSSIKIEQRLTGCPITGLGFAVLKNSAA